MKPSNANMFWGIDTKGPTLLNSFVPQHSTFLDQTSRDLQALTKKHEEADTKAAITAAISSARSTTSSDIVANNPFGNPISSEDPVTAALTSSSSPSSTYYDVLKALIAAVRTLLIPKKSDNQILSLPRMSQLGEAFPKSIKDEDPSYFYMLSLKQKEEASKNSNYVKGLEKAWVVVKDEDLFYAFDRKAIPLPHQINQENKKRAKAMQKKQFGDIAGSRSRTPIIVGASRRNNNGNTGRLSYDIAKEDEDEEFLVCDPHFRKDSVIAIEARHGSLEGIQTVIKAAGGTSIAIGVGGSNNPNNKPIPVAPNVMADTLRWVEQQRVAQEHKRARCEHVIHLLSEEIAKETKRQQRLRIGASKFAASEARAHGDPDWKTYLIGVAENDEKGAKKSIQEEREERLLAGLDPKANLRSLRFHQKDEQKGKIQLSSNGGASRFSAKDMALVRFECARERAEGTDAIMRILEDYRMVPLSVAASYLEQTLQTMDDLYAELVGARMKDASGGISPSKEQLISQLAKVREDVEINIENEENEETYQKSLSPEERELHRRLNMRKARRKQPDGIIPNTYYQLTGGAVPIKKHEDLLENKLYGAAMPGRGLSAFNMRPSQGRAAVREAGKIIIPSNIDDGFEDPHLTSAMKKDVYTNIQTSKKVSHKTLDEKSPYSRSVGNGSVLSSSTSGSKGPQGMKPPRIVNEEDDEFPDFDQVLQLENFAAKVGQDKSRKNYANVIKGQADHAVKYAASQTVALLSTSDQDTKVPVTISDKSHDIDTDSMIIGGKTNLFVKIRTMRNKELAEKEAKAAAKAAYNANKPNPVVAFPGGGDPTPGAFKELEADLIKWRETSRPSWQQQIKKSYDLSNLRESTGMMLGHIQRTAKEPPDGRFSHLTGRYMMADDLRVQLNDARKQKFEKSG
jgi:hypothetical protein